MWFGIIPAYADTITTIRNKALMIAAYLAMFLKGIFLAAIINSTVAVITIVLVTALIVFVLDLGFEAIKTHGIDKLQASLQSNNSNTVENTTSESADDASSESNTVEGNSSEAENTTENAQ